MPTERDKTQDPTNALDTTLPAHTNINDHPSKRLKATNPPKSTEHQSSSTPSTNQRTVFPPDFLLNPLAPPLPAPPPNCPAAFLKIDPSSTLTSSPLLANPLIRHEAKTAIPTVFNECFFCLKDGSGVSPISSRRRRSALLLQSQKVSESSKPKVSCYG